MAIRITCPGCKTSLKLSDEKRGKKVRCSNCEKTLNIPAANGKKHADDDEVAQKGQKSKTKAAAPAEEEQQEEEEQPTKKKKKKKKKKGSMTALLIGGGVGVLILLIAAVSASAYILTRPGDSKPIVVAKNPDPEEKDNRSPQRIVSPDIRDGNPANQKAGGKSITGNMRGQIYRLERKAELRQIALLYTAYCDETARNFRTEEGFLKSMERDYGKVVQVIREGYYVVNMKADPKDSSSIVVYENRIDTPGYLCARPGGDVDFVPEAEWKKLLGK